MHNTDSDNGIVICSNDVEEEDEDEESLMGSEHFLINWSIICNMYDVRSTWPASFLGPLLLLMYNCCPVQCRNWQATNDAINRVPNNGVRVQRDCFHLSPRQ